MSAKRISQREARRLRARVIALETEREDARRTYASNYPSGTNIARMSIACDGAILSAIKTARALRHAVVVTTCGNELMFYATPAAKGMP